MSPSRGAAASLLCAVLPLTTTALAQEPATPPAAPEPKVAWIYTPPKAEFDQLLAGDDTLYALDRRGELHAIDPATGEALWTTGKRFGFGWHYGLALSTAADFPALLVGSDAGLFAVSLEHGEPLWQRELAGGAAAPACAGEVVVVGSSDGNVYGCDLRTGEIRWQRDCVADRPADPPGLAGKQARFDGHLMRPGAATTDGTLAVVTFFDQCRAVAFDAASGEKRWSFATQGWVYPGASIDARNVYVASQDRHLYAVDKELGKESWNVETKARNEGAAAPEGRFAFFGSCDGHLYAVDTGVGRVAWKFRIEPNAGGVRPIYATPLVEQDTVYLAAMPGVVYAVDRQNGELRWQLRPLPMSELIGGPLRIGDRLFVSTRKSPASETSAVIAIDLP
ncbi:MAG: PQQ-like beta-propeller repeat protein [Planctomycetes bacterium]|nr:PQQ-like beta-propeller repeat protein [Planctomycetota bacterium]